MRELIKFSIRIVGFFLILGFLIIRLSSIQIGPYLPLIKYKMGAYSNTSQEIQVYKPYYSKNVFTAEDKVVLLHDLCIQPDNDRVKLVSYGHPQNKTISIPVKGGRHFIPRIHKFDKWTVHLTTLPRPKTGLDFNAAFFVTTTCDGNMYHFWTDMGWGLFGAMKATGMLGSKMPSQLYYHEDLWIKDKKFGCNDPSRYQDILYALPVRKEHIWYKMATPHSCYDNAVFGYYAEGYNFEDLREYFRKAFNINCPPCSSTRVTIINRKIRTILNAEEMKQAATKAGFYTKVVYLSNLSIREQFKAIMCTDILVGVHGAGLRWIDFLPKKSSLLELHWKHWETYYARFALKQKRKAYTLAANKVKLNLTAYFDIVKNKIPTITKELISQYETKPPNNGDDNHWKYAMGVFDTNQFVTNLKKLIP